MQSTAEKSPNADRKLQTDEVTGALTVAIHQHRILPGTKLGEDELSEIFGVSRTIIRAALHSLAHSQLVEVRRNRGAFVAQPTVREANEVFEARELVEPRMAEYAADRATKADIRRLRTHIKKEHAALAKSDSGKALHFSGQFHVEVARIADQTTIAGIVEALIARSSLIIALYWRRESALCEQNAHEALVEAIADGHGAQAADLMLEHLKHLHTALDLNERKMPGRSLKDVLVG